MTANPTNIYSYATGDLLHDRNTYSYTTYHGTAFLQAWRDSREQVLAAPQPAAQPAAGPQPSATPTSTLLLGVRAGLAGGSRTQALVDLNRLLQRFEVTKRVHGEYNQDWRPVDPEDFRSLALYLEFGRTLSEAYAATGVLQYLNGLLKCVDTLAAYLPDLSGLQLECLRGLVRQERDYVEALGSTLGVATA